MGHKKKKNRMHTVNNTIEQQAPVIEDKSIVESSIPAPITNANESDSSDSTTMQSGVSQTTLQVQNNN